MAACWWPMEDDTAADETFRIVSGSVKGCPVQKQCYAWLDVFHSTLSLHPLPATHRLYYFNGTRELSGFLFDENFTSSYTIISVRHTFMRTYTISAWHAEDTNPDRELRFFLSSPTSRGELTRALTKSNTLAYFRMKPKRHDFRKD